MKSFLSKLEFLKNYLLQLSIPKKALLSLAIIFIVAIICVKQYLPSADLKNAFNSQTIIRAMNIGNANNKIIFESNDKKVEVENNVNGQGESLVIIKDVGSKWKQKTLQAKIVGDGELAIKMSGVYAEFSNSSTIFVDYKNLKINGQEIFTDIKTGRNDKDELIFKVPVKDEQTLEMSIEYKNAIDFQMLLIESYDIIKNNFALFIFLLLFTCMYLFNTENQARKVCKIWICLLTICGIYFIFLNVDFGEHADSYYSILPFSAIDKSFAIERFDARFHPTALREYAILRLLPYGHTSYPHGMINILMFIFLIFLMANILDFKSKQKTASLYIKLFLIISLPFMANTLLREFYLYPQFHRATALFLALFLFAYKRMMELTNEIHYFHSNDDRSNSNSYKQNSNEGWENKKDSQKIFWTIVALFSAAWVTYLNEIVFGVFAILAMTNLLFARNTLGKDGKFFNFTLLANVPIYLILYYLFAFRVRQTFYAFPVPRILHYIDNPILILVIIFTLIRLYFVLFKKDRQHIFYDGILFASFGYLSAHEIIGVFNDNKYFISVVILFLPICCYWMKIFYDKKKYLIFYLICVSIIAISINGGKMIKMQFIVYHNLANTGIYNILKIDLFSKYGAPFLYYHSEEDYTFPFVAYYAFDYINTDFFHTKSMDETEIINSNRKYTIIEEANSIDKTAIYISYNVDLVQYDKRFSDFVVFADWQPLYLLHIYAYVHKNRL